MGIELHDLADYVGGFCPVSVKQTDFKHCIENLAVRRFEAVNSGYRAAEYDTHRVGHEILFYCVGYLLIDYFTGKRNMSLVVKLSRIALICFFRFLSHKNSCQESSVGSIYLYPFSAI